MNLLITSDGIPIYKQIKEQIKQKILNKELKAGLKLPSIRALAADLQISIITIKRVYSDLERENFIESFGGRGSFVSKSLTDSDLEETSKEIITSKINEILIEAQQLNISQIQVEQIVKNYYKESSNV